MKAHSIGGLAALVLGMLSLSTANAASIYITPEASEDLPGASVSLDLYMDFTGTPTLGGGIDVFVSGPLSFVSFTPSAYFDGLDPAFTGHGPETAGGGAATAIYIGSFGGLSGINLLGSLNLSLTGPGLGEVSFAANQFWGGGFFDLSGSLEPMQVDFFGAEVNAVPLPATAWLMLTGVGALVARRLRRSPSAEAAC